jgi:hypothetical protein
MGRDDMLPIALNRSEFKPLSNLGRKKRMWTPDEDDLLQRVAGGAPETWNIIGAAVPGRTGKQCRERWVHNLRPNVRKGHWTRDEDEIILREQAKLGYAWSVIARLVAGRSDNAVKNRMNSCLARRTQTGGQSQRYEQSPRSTLTAQLSLDSRTGSPVDGESHDRSVSDRKLKSHNYGEMRPIVLSN